MVRQWIAFGDYPFNGRNGRGYRLFCSKKRKTQSLLKGRTDKKIFFTKRLNRTDMFYNYIEQRKTEFITL